MATDSTITIQGTLKNASGTALSSAVVVAKRLQSAAVAASLLDGSQASAGMFSASTNSSGVFSITVTHALAPTCPLTYRVQLPDGRYFILPVGVNDGGRIFNVGTLLCESSPARFQDINITTLVQKNMMESGSSQRASVPTAVASTVFAADSVFGDFHSTVVRMAGVPVTAANTTGISFGGTKILQFPEGKLYVISSYLREEITFGLSNEGNVTPITGAMGGDIAIGTTAPTDGTLTGTDVDLIPSTSIDPISDGSGLTLLAAVATLDGTSAAKAAYMNVLIDDADVANAASDILEVSGVWVVNWVYMGD